MTLQRPPAAMTGPSWTATVPASSPGQLWKAKTRSIGKRSSRPSADHRLGADAVLLGRLEDELRPCPLQLSSCAASRPRRAGKRCDRHGRRHASRPASSTRKARRWFRRSAARPCRRAVRPSGWSPAASASRRCRRRRCRRRRECRVRSASPARRRRCRARVRKARDGRGGGGATAVSLVEEIRRPWMRPCR